MLYIFNLDEQLVAVLENKDGEACSLESVKLKENLTGEFSLEFELPAQHDDWQYIKERYYVAVEDTDGTMQLFIVAEITDTHAERMTKTVFCDHASIEMNDEIIEEVVISKENSSSAFGAVMAGSKWTIGASDATVSKYSLTARMKPRRNVLVQLAERWGVELAYRVTLVNNSIGTRYVDLKLQRGSRRGKRLEYSKDMQEITRTVNADFLKTALYGVGKAYDPPTAAKEEDVPDEEKLRVNFVGVDWSTASGLL